VRKMGYVGFDDKKKQLTTYYFGVIVYHLEEIAKD